MCPRDLWKEFKQTVLPKDASAVQVSEMQKAFFAGMRAGVNGVLELGQEEGEEDADAAKLEQFNNEIDEACLDIIIVEMGGGDGKPH
jgi:hypothetical protein